ncbi:murein biosynthesis integral membrane protein MurJ [soil metagenome]
MSGGSTDSPEGSRPTSGRGSRPTSGRGSLLVAAGIGASRTAGLVREAVLAAFLGSGAAAEAFTAAFRIPNLLQNLLGEGVLSASFIPSYARLLDEGREEDAAKVARTVLTLLLLVTGFLVVIGVIAAGPLTALVAPGFAAGDERRELTVSLIQIVTPGIGLLVASAWCLGVLNSHRRFFLSYVAPVLWNAAQILALVVAGLLVFTEADALGTGALINADARGLALTLGWATVVGAALQLGVQIPTVRRLRPDLTPSLSIDPETRTVLKRFLPALGGRGVVQLSAYLDVLLASFLVAGGLANLRYGQALYLLPISLFGMSIAAAELPELSVQTTLADKRQAAAAFARRLRAGLARIAWFVVPTAVVFIGAGDLLVGALLQRGRFDRTDTLMVWAILAAYGIGLIAATASRLLQSALYGLGDTHTPARASIVRVGVSLVVGVVLMFQLDRVGLGDAGLALAGDLPALGPVEESVRTAAGVIPRLGAAGLALGSAAAAWVELRILRQRLTRVTGPLDVTGGTLPHVLPAALSALIVTLLARVVLGTLHPLPLGVLALGAGGVTYLIGTRLLGFPFSRAARGRAPDRSATVRWTRRKGS